MKQIAETRGMMTRISGATGLSIQAVRSWKQVPPEWCQIVGKIINKPPHKIRPDIFPKPD